MRAPLRPLAALALLVLLSLLPGSPLALASEVAGPHTPPPPGGDNRDPWLDATGDTLYGPLDVNNQSILLAGHELRGQFAPARLTYAGRALCLQGDAACAGAQGPPGSVRPVACAPGMFVREVREDGTALCDAPPGAEVHVSLPGTQNVSITSAPRLEVNGTLRLVEEDAAPPAPEPVLVAQDRVMRDPPHTPYVEYRTPAQWSEFVGLPSGGWDWCRLRVVTFTGANWGVAKYHVLETPGYPPVREYARPIFRVDEHARTNETILRASELTPPIWAERVEFTYLGSGMDDALEFRSWCYRGPVPPG
jgi:hypothetical protein